MMKHKQINPLYVHPGIDCSSSTVSSDVDLIPHQSSLARFSIIAKKAKFHPKNVQRKSVNVYPGAKRAFLASYERRSKEAKRLIQRNFDDQEKIRSVIFENQMKLFKASIKIRPDNTMQREMRSQAFNASRNAPSTTGPLPKIVLPPDVQVTENNRQRIYYWG